MAGSGWSVCYQYRMLRRRTFALLLAVALLAFPATSLAQSAGDNQYQDPLAGQGGGGHSSNPGSHGSGSNSSPSGSPSTPSTAPTAATPSGSTGTGSAGDPPATAAQASSRGQLPRTGFDVILTIELGLAMLLAGLVSHRLLVLRDRR